MKGIYSRQSGHYLRMALMLTIFHALVLFPDAPARGDQVCRDYVRHTSPDSSFTVNGDGTATDNTTGLMWMRCSLGQTWDGKTCQGEALLTNWAKSLQTSKGFQFAGYADWRLPNKNELESIVEQRCYSPAINAGVFPKTPPAFFWTSSPYAGLAHGAWSVDFGFGNVSATVKTGKINVRLVRDSE